MATCYNELLELLREHSNPSDKIYAGPDAPEVSFLANRPPLDGVMYEFFHETMPLWNKLENSDVKLVVINLEPAFSKAYDKEEIEWLSENFRFVKSIPFKDRFASAKDKFLVYQRKDPPRQTFVTAAK